MKLAFWYWGWLLRCLLQRTVSPGGNHSPRKKTPAVHIYQAYDLFAKVHGVGVVVNRCWWGSICGEIQQWVTSETMQVEWAIHYRESLIKKIGNLAKVTM